MGRIIFISLLKVFLLPLLPCVSESPSSPSTTERRALFVIDMQGCFLDKCGSVPAGSLAVGNSHAIIPTIAAFHKWGKASGYMDFAIFSADAHPPDNISFAENHMSDDDDDDDISPNSSDTTTTARSLERELRPRKPFEKINLVCNLGAFGLGTHDDEKAAVTNDDERPKCCVFKKGSTILCRCELDATTGAVKHPHQCRIIEQTLWPRHCVVRDGDHAISSFLTPEPGVDAVVEKGTEVDLDSYSAVFPNLNLTRAEIQREAEKREKSYILPPYKLLLDRGIREVFITGVATDFCVRSTAHDLHALGFDVTVIRDAVRGVFPHANGDAYFEHTFEQQGIKVKTSEEVVAGSGSDVRMEKILELDCGKHKSTFLWPFMFLLGYLWF